MSGAGTDYTLTPTLGLYKPIANMAVGLWGDLLNTNADAIDAAIHFATGGGPYLPLAGATVFGPTTFTGPLNYTATGGSVARSAQDRSADVANVLDYGADPTGAADSTAAIRSAIATGRAVWLPKGNYLVTDVLTLGANQLMYGDGRTATQLIAYAPGGGVSNPALWFNASALGVVQLAAVETSSSIRDLGIVFAQGDTGVRANLYAFPPAIYAVNAPRFSITRVRVSGAMIGLNATGNCGGSFITDFECSAFNVGMMFDGALDCIHIKAVHFWNYGINVSGGSGLATIFQDGTVLALQAGRVDGLIMIDFFTMFGSIVFTANSTTSTFITHLVMDRNTTVTFNGPGSFSINGLTITSGGAAPLNTVTGKPIVAITNGRVFISNPNLAIGASQSVSGIQVSGTGELAFDGGAFLSSTPSISMISTAGTHLRIKGARFYPQGTAMTVPFINQTGGSIVVSDCEFGSTGSGVGIAVNADNILNRIVDNIMSNFTSVFPTTDPVIGTYSQFNGQPGQQLTLGITGRSGQVGFRRGSDGAYKGWAGFATDSSVLSLTHTASSSAKVTLNTVAANGIAALQVASADIVVATAADTTMNSTLHVKQGGATAFQVTTAASAPANYLSILPAVAGGIVWATALGTDTNIVLGLNGQGTGGVKIGGAVGFNNVGPVAKPTVSGAWAGNTAGKALSAALAAYGLVTDSTSA